MTDSIADRAICFVTEYYEKQGWNVNDVSHARGEHSGYDLLATKDLLQLKIEVK